MLTQLRTCNVTHKLMADDGEQLVKLGLTNVKLMQLVYKLIYENTLLSTLKCTDTLSLN